MLSWLAQTLAVTLLNLRNIGARAGSSAVAVVGISGVVIVFVAVLSIAAGFRAVLTDAGRRTPRWSCARAATAR